MASRIPVYRQDGYYHIYNRGCHRAFIFQEKDNYLFVIQKIKHYIPILQLTVIAYCLMPNHYHLLVRQDGEKPAGLLPQRVFNSYSKAYNKRYEHSGTLFEGSYKAKEITSDAHLLHLCRYIHGNPVKDGLVADPADWPYSNYLEWIGQRRGSLFDHNFVWLNFDTPEIYRDFVFDDLRGRTLPKEFKQYLDDF